MIQKQISLTMPKMLFEVSQKYSQKFGYRTLQEFILDILRRKIILENHERYKAIEERMRKGIRVKRFDQNGSEKYLKSL